MSGVPQRLLLALLLLPISVGGMGSGIECTLSKFAGDTRCGVVDILKRRDTIQRDLQRWVRVNFTKFSNAKMVQHLVQGNFKYWYRLSKE